MAYSCSDFVDDVLNNLVILGLIKKEDIPDDNPEGQATLAIQSIIRASAGAASAKAFFVELLESVETLSAVSDEYDPATLAQLMYLETAILTVQRLNCIRTKPQNWHLFERCRQASGGGNTYRNCRQTADYFPFFIDPAGKRSQRGRSA